MKKTESNRIIDLIAYELMMINNTYLDWNIPKANTTVESTSSFCKKINFAQQIKHFEIKKTFL